MSLLMISTDSGWVAKCVFRFFFMFLGGGFDHLEKYESQWEGLYHIMKWKKDRNHQPGFFMAGFPPDMVIGYPNQICYIMGKLMKRSMVSPLPKQDVGEHQR